MESHHSPYFTGKRFRCPNCGVVANQRWSCPTLTLSGLGTILAGEYLFSRCDACDKLSLWLQGQLVYPLHSAVSTCNVDAPLEVKTDFEEAVLVFRQSPRSSCALLRLALQRLCIALGYPGKNLNSDIGLLVEKGLPEQIQQSLDIVRVVGNEQVHPGVLDVRDNPQIALTLFDLINLIIEYTISNPKRIGELFAKLPQGAKDQIAKRDSGSLTVTTQARPLALLRGETDV